MATSPKSIMTPAHAHHKNHVKFGEDVKPEAESKPRPVSPAPPPSEITVPPPAVPCKIKDEVELLRAGLVNKHGDHLKTHHATEK
ncbi:hypothetical protein RB195_020667 [Necator americanus]|uniref:WH2 domain-containing protein n=1 Tax=Necator americanus TaxID=51031 RepID=A0ABR1CJW0_NECAM